MKDKIKKWWPYLIALTIIIIAVPIWPYYFDIYVSAGVWYSIPVISGFCIFSIFKWG